MRTLAALAVALLISAAARAQAPVAVRVVEIEGGRAYLQPGENGGVGRGATVVLRGRRFTVKSASATWAVIEPGDAPVREGDRGQATSPPSKTSGAVKLAAPVPLERFAGMWPDPRWPSADKKVRPMPLGGGAGGGPVRLELIGQSAVFAAKDRAVAGRALVEANVTVEPWRDRPFGIDADAAATAFFDGNVGPVAGAQPNAVVRELRLRYGPGADPFAALGRLRWAARTVGMLDGVRLRTPAFAGFSIAGFGGFVPNAVTSAPATDAARFGAEVDYDAPRVHAGVVAYGSTFAGSIDERRLAATLDLAPGPVILDARAELGLFDKDNPWGLDTVELLGAGAGAGVHVGRFRAELRLDLRQPERSRWLASLLPPGYLCTAPPDGDGCDPGQKLRLAATATAGVELGRLVLSVGGTTVGGDSSSENSVFADARLVGLLGRGRVGVGGALTSGSFLDQRTVRADVGAAFLAGAVDLDLYWRGSALDYRAATTSYLEHRVGLDAALAAGPRTDLVLSVEGMTGAEIDALTVLGTVVWRPLP